MSITAPDDRISEYNPVVSTTEFPATFPIFDNDDLKVFVEGEERDDFAVSATYVEGISSNARAVFASGLTGKIQVVGARDPRRTNRFISGAPLPIRDVNLALDTVEAEVQEIHRQVERAHKAPFGVDGGVFNADDVANAEAYAEQAKSARDAALLAASSIAVYSTRAVASTYNLSGLSEVTIGRWLSSSRHAPATYKSVPLEPAHAAKFQSSDGGWWEISGIILNVWSLGAMGDNSTPDSAAFLLAGSFANRMVIVPYTGANYLVSGTFPISCYLVGDGKPTIFLTTAGEKGFWLQSGSSFKNFRIERAPTASAISGEFNNAIVIGEYCTLGTSYANIEIDNVDLVGIEGGIGRRSIMGIYGNVRDCTISNMRIVGLASYGMMIHWGGNFDAALPDTGAVTLSWHPRRITLDNVFMDTFAPDNGLGGLYLSGAHDITASRVAVHNCRAPFTVAAGDVGGLVAQGESRNSVCKNIRFENCTIKNYEVVGFLVGGVSGTRAGGTWYAIDEDTSISIDGLTIERGPLSTGGRAIDFRMFQNIDVDGLNIAHQSGGYSTIFTPAVFIQACNSVTVNGRTKVPFAHEVVGSTNIKIGTDDYCLRTDFDTNCYGTRVTGQSGAKNLFAALSVSDTTLQLVSLDFDIIAGARLTVGGRTVLARKAQATSATPVTIQITPSPVAAASGVSVTIEKPISEITLSGRCEGFYVGVLANNANAGYTKNINVDNRHFRRSGLYDVYGRAARTLRISKCSMEDSGQLDLSTSNNIRFTDGCISPFVTMNSFEDNPDAFTKSRHNVYIHDGTLGAHVNDNSFFNAMTSAINHFAKVPAGMEHQIGGNWFGPLLPAGATGRISGTSTVSGYSIGDKMIYVVTAIPAVGIGEDGDWGIHKDATTGQSSYWQKRTGSWQSVVNVP